MGLAKKAPEATERRSEWLLVNREEIQTLRFSFSVFQLCLDLVTGGRKKLFQIKHQKLTFVIRKLKESPTA
jgi:hypothetical protein